MSTELSNAFIIYSGKKGCVHAPPLFVWYISVTLETAFMNVKQDVSFEFWTSRGFFHRIKIIVKTVHDLLFTEDGALVANTLEDVQWIIKNNISCIKCFLSETI